jgi:hypothetical protein
MKESCARTFGQYSQHAVRRGDAVTSAFNRQLNDVSGSKYWGFGANEAPPELLDALIDRQNRNIAGTRQSPVIQQGRQ